MVALTLKQSKKLKRNEHRVMNFIAENEGVRITQNIISNDLGISSRTVRTVIRTLREYNILNSKKHQHGNFYINDNSLWDLEKYTTKKFNREVDRLVKEENERHLKEDYNGIIERT